MLMIFPRRDYLERLNRGLHGAVSQGSDRIGL